MDAFVAKWSRPLRAIAVFCVVFVLACRRNDVAAARSDPSAPASAPRAAESFVTPAASRAALAIAKVDTSAKPVNLLIQLSPASSASIAADDDAVYVETNPPAKRIEGLHAKMGPSIYVMPSEDKTIEIPIYAATGWALTRSSIVYAARGSLFRVPKLGGKPVLLGRVPVGASHFATSGEHVAWAEAPNKNQYLIRLLEPSGEIRQLHRGDGQVDAVAIDAARVVFLDKHGKAWRLGSKPLTDGEAVYTEERTDAAPESLALSDQVYFYRADGKELSRFATDLGKEEIVARDIDCTLLAVAAQIYCAGEAGIFEIAKKPGSQAVSIFTPEERMTGLAVSSNRLAWIGDFTLDKLTVDMLPIRSVDPAR